MLNAESLLLSSFPQTLPSYVPTLKHVKHIFHIFLGPHRQANQWLFQVSGAAAVSVPGARYYNDNITLRKALNNIHINIFRSNIRHEDNIACMSTDYAVCCYGLSVLMQCPTVWTVFTCLCVFSISVLLVTVLSKTISKRRLQRGWLFQILIRSLGAHCSTSSRRTRLCTASDLWPSVLTTSVDGESTVTMRTCSSLCVCLLLLCATKAEPPPKKNCSTSRHRFDNGSVGRNLFLFSPHN